MYSVMIVDDEKAIRDNLPKLIDFARYGFEVSQTARNGADALDKIRRQPPDLLLADIRMPVLDGLGLLQQLQSEGLADIPTILLSGYSDFAYARQAMKLGVKAYLTKPVDEEEAETLLSEVAALLKRKKQLEQLQLIEQHKQRLTEALLADRPFTALAGDTLLYCVLFSVYSDCEARTPYRVLQDCLQALLPGYDLLCQVTGFYYIYYLPDNLLQQAGGTEAWLRRLKLQAENRGLSGAFVADTEILRSRSSLSGCLSRHKLRLLSYLLYHQNQGRALWLAQLPAEPDQATLSGTDVYLNRLRQQLQDGHSEAAVRTFAACCDLLKEQRASWRQLSDLNYILYYILSEALKESGQTEVPDSVRHPGSWSTNTYFYPFAQWQELYSQSILDVCMLTDREQKQGAPGVLGDILAYLKQHYREAVTIKEVADHFHMNAAYLGRMFQKATGVSFKHYVNRLRITQARLLLRQTDAKIYEIAEQIGFSDSKYFIARFIQAEGVSPTEYRKKDRGKA